MTFTIRPITEEERPEFRLVMGLVFNFEPTEEGEKAFNSILEVDRTICAFDGDRLVGTAGAFSFDMTVPGGVLPVAGTTMVTVLATHRRRGALRQMMRAHLDEARNHGDALAGLWASESSIYSRFGFGPAADLVDVEIDRRHTTFRSPPLGTGAVRLVEAEEAKQLLPVVYEQTRLQRPGMYARSEVWWEHSTLRDPEQNRHGATSYRYAVYEEAGEPRGYVQYRAKEEWSNDGFPEGEIRVTDLQAIDLAATDALWRYVVSVDLVKTIGYWNLPSDDPLPWLLSEPRRLTGRVSDSLWICPIDIPMALEGRHYSQPGRLVLEVRDDFNTWNNGSFLLETTGTETKCSATTAEPDVRLTAADLGSIYLGGIAMRTLAAAGRVEGSTEALAEADAMFTWHPAPWCPEVF
jgi:predicted acetyltransferase